MLCLSFVSFLLFQILLLSYVSKAAFFVKVNKFFRFLMFYWGQFIVEEVMLILRLRSFSRIERLHPTDLFAQFRQYSYLKYGK